MFKTIGIVFCLFTNIPPLPTAPKLNSMDVPSQTPPGDVKFPCQV
jgi:hypothetical protein